MKVVIAGSRSITDHDLVTEVIFDSGFDITEVVCGGAYGVDLIGKRWGHDRDIRVKMFMADWEKHGKKAGPIRNQAMAEYADAAIIICNDSSKGALSMLNSIKNVGKPYYIVYLENMEFVKVDDHGISRKAT